jgi:hypothetical protein
MKRLKLIFTFLIMFALAGNALEKQGFGFYTDRDVYVSGETVLAKMFIPSGNFSGIAHLDLVNRSGKRISGVSIEIRNSQADGYFQLPDSLSSGTYLLRAYLRNSADECRIVREIWVANRFDGLEKITGINKVENVEQLPAQMSNEIKMTGLEEEVKTNAGIQAQVQLDETLLQKLDGNLLISVARMVPQFEPSTFQMATANAQPGLTEGTGIIFSGTVTDRKTAIPVSKVTVYLTIPDTIPGFQYYITGNDGRFYFLIDKYYGNIQPVIQCYPNDKTQRLKIIQDEPFAAIGTMPEYSTQPISEEFRNDITRSIDALTFQKIFGQETLMKLTPPKKKPDAYAYYGIPSNRVDPQLFIDLPNFTEISKELLHGVKFRNHNNEPSMQVINSPMRSYFNEQPLILLDGIPIRDLNVIKDMGTTDIDRVEICQSERFYGNLKFPGVVAIYSTKSDYSKLAESDQLIKLKTEANQIPVQLAETVASELSVPDLRQVLYWNAKSEPAKTINVKFGTSNILGRFRMVVRGRTTDGTLIFAEKQFEVK